MNVTSVMKSVILITVETKVVPNKEFITKYHDMNYWVICIYNLIALCKNISYF